MDGKFVSEAEAARANAWLREVVARTGCASLSLLHTHMLLLPLLPLSPLALPPLCRAFCFSYGLLHLNLTPSVGHPVTLRSSSAQLRSDR